MTWTLLLAAQTALAGPLLLPDPDEMGEYRCRRYPVGADNNVEIGDDRAVGESPPGPPTFPHGLQSSLVPHATDTDIKQAGKGKRIEVLPALASLATGGRPARLACEAREATDQDFFEFGCKKPLACNLILLAGKTEQLEQRDEVGATIKPVRSAKAAVGLVALLDSDVFLPMTPGELESWAEAAQGYRAVEPAVDWVQVEEHDDGFVVRLPRRVTCGCEQDVVRRAWWVAHDGRSCQLEEVAVALAQAVDPECEP